MLIIETSIFTRLVQSLLSDEDYRKLQKTLVLYPDLGALIPGGGGLRKVRWAVRGQGKRSGMRVIYYWAVSQEKILMLYIYSKTNQADLTQAQIKVLRSIIEEEYP